MFSGEVINLYDSHVHFLSTGLNARQLDLRQLRKLEDLQSIKINDNYFRGNWLVGFGWDEFQWKDSHLLHRKTLDKIFPNFPVFFIRADGHSSCVNSQTLKILGISDTMPSSTQLDGNSWLSFVGRDPDGIPNGILRESAHMQAFLGLPSLGKIQIRQALQNSIKIFNQAGFSHIRDMSSDLEQINLLREIYDQNQLSLFIDAQFTCENLNELDRILKGLSYARLNLKMNDESLMGGIYLGGVKVYYDGSLGSETAYLSKPYPHKNSSWSGARFWSLDDLAEVFRQTWNLGFELSIHTIGDQAVDDIIELARKISAEGYKGHLNLEHVEVLRAETILKMKPLHIRCHLQPCHWHTDQVWIKEKLGSLFKWAFPWESLRAAKIPISFGSDSPIESPSLINNLTALKESVKFGIRELTDDPLKYHSYPTNNFYSFQKPVKTIFVDGKASQIKW